MEILNTINRVGSLPAQNGPTTAKLLFFPLIPQGRALVSRPNGVWVSVCHSAAGTPLPKCTYVTWGSLRKCSLTTALNTSPLSVTNSLFLFIPDPSQLNVLIALLIFCVFMTCVVYFFSFKLDARVYMTVNSIFARLL